MTQKAYQKLAAMKRNRQFADEARTMKERNDKALRAYETDAEQILAAVKARHDYDRLVADGGYTWSPCVSVKFPADGSLLSDPMPFLDFAKKELAGMSENWAEKWISDNRHDETRQKALLAALQKKYAPETGPDENPK